MKEIDDTKCPKCGSDKFCWHTDKNLRAEDALLGQCWDCETWWIVYYKRLPVDLRIVNIDEYNNTKAILADNPQADS